jgi:hypothetical protein
MGLKGYRLWVMGQLDSNVQSPTAAARRFLLFGGFPATAHVSSCASMSNPGGRVVNTTHTKRKLLRSTTLFHVGCGLKKVG